MAKALELHFGTPQDMEWAVSADLPFPDSIFLLQTRPVAGIKAKASTGGTAHVMDEMIRAMYNQ